MSSARRLIAVLLAAGVMFAPGATTRAEDELAGPHAFDDGLQLVRAELEGGSCKKGLELLKELLEQHTRKNYVKGRRVEIEDLTRSLACGVQFKRPRAKDVVSGTLQSWSPKTGKIRIKYTPKKKDDFEERDGLLTFPARIVGPFTFEVKGRAYPNASGKAPRVVLDGDQHPESGKVQTWKIGFGLPPASKKARKASEPAHLIHVDGDDEKTIANKDRVFGKPGKAYKLRVKVTKAKVMAYNGSKSIGTAPKPEGVFGYLAFQAAFWTEAKLTGQVDPTWIESEIEEILRTQLDEFEKDYDASTYLPDWLSDPLTKESGPKRKKRNVDLLADLDDKFYDEMQDVFNDIRMDEFDGALARIDKMRGLGAPEATCEYMRAEVYKRQTQLEKALVHIKRAVELEPKFLEGILMRASMLRELGRYDEALEAFQQAAVAHGQLPRAYEQAAQAMLMAGRPADAKRITQLAARNGVTSKDLVSLNDALAKAVGGPRWRKRYQHKSHNYHVMSDMDQSLCAEAARILEEAFASYRVTLGWVPRDKTRLFKVFLFSTRDGFMDYQRDLEKFMGKPSEMAAGLYSPLLKQLLIWNLPQRQEMLNTIRHEGFHQYLDRLMPSPPVWLNEGLAVYHENAVKIDGKLTFGQMHPNYVRLLQARGLVALEKFLYYGPAKFYEGVHRSYGQAWLLVHMMQHTTPDYLALFKTMVKELQAGTSFGVVKKTFPPERLPKVEQDLRNYLAKLGS